MTMEQSGLLKGEIRIDGKRLQEARLACGLTQEAVAAKIGRSKQVVSNYECGEAFPSGNILLQLCIIYGIDIVSLRD